MNVEGMEVVRFETPTELRMYSGPLAEMRELEKRGVDEIMTQLKARYELRDFGVPELVGLNVCDAMVLAKVMASPLWSTAVYSARDYVLTVAKEKVLDVRQLPVEELGPQEVDLGVIKSTRYTARWTVPDRETGAQSFVYYAGFYSQLKDITRFLLHHEIDEQLLFSGVRVFDPHNS